MPLSKETKPNLVLSACAVEYTDCINAVALEQPPTSVLDMTLNNLMVRLQ